MLAALDDRLVTIVKSGATYTLTDIGLLYGTGAIGGVVLGQIIERVTGGAIPADAAAAAEARLWRWLAAPPPDAPPPRRLPHS